MKPKIYGGYRARISSPNLVCFWVLLTRVPPSFRLLIRDPNNENYLQGLRDLGVQPCSALLGLGFRV